MGKCRKERLLDKLQARTDRHGKPRAGYEQSVAMIQAELRIAEEIVKGVEDNAS